MTVFICPVKGCDSTTDDVDIIGTAAILNVHSHVYPANATESHATPVSCAPKLKRPKLQLNATTKIWNAFVGFMMKLSMLLSNNYVIIKACSRNIKGSTNLTYSKNVNLLVPVRLSFQCLPLFLVKEKSAKNIYFATGCCFIHPHLIFTTESLIISLQHIKLCISLLSLSHEHSALPVIKVPPLIVRVILQSWSIKTVFLNSLRH